MGKHSLKGVVYDGLKVANDINAVRRRKTGRRVTRRIAGKAAGRLLGRVFG